MNNNDFKNRGKNGTKIFYKKLAFAVFAALTPRRQPTPKNGLRHFSALHTHHPNTSVADTYRKENKLKKQIENE